MNKVLLPLAVLAVSAAGWQTYELSEERSRAASLEERVKKIEEQSAAFEKEAGRLKQQNAAFRSESEELRRRLAEQKEKGTSDAGVAKADANGFEPVAPPAAEGDKKKDFASSMAKMFTDPEMKKAMRSQQGMGMRMVYGDLGKELGLSPEQASQVMELLTDRQMEVAGKSMGLMGGGKGEKDLAAAGEEIQKTTDEFNKQIEGALGSEKYGKFQEYERTLGERMAIGQVQQQFSSKGFPLDDGQRQSLLNIMVEERLAAPKNAFNNYTPNRDVAAQMKAIQSDEGIDQALETQKQLNLRIQNRAASLLSPDQVNALKESQDQFLEMQRFGMKMGRQMMGK